MPTRQNILDYQGDYDTMGANGSQLLKHKPGTSQMKYTPRVLVAQYNFADLGGAIGAVTLRDPNTGLAAKLPNGALIRDVVIDVITDPTSLGSATIAFGAASTTDLKAATAIATYTAIIAGIPVSAATSIKLAADATLTATIATAALTAGKINLIITYVNYL